MLRPRSLALPGPRLTMAVPRIARAASALLDLRGECRGDSSRAGTSLPGQYLAKEA
jgi:hypothetical protein